MCVLSLKEPKRKKSGNLFNDPRTIKKGTQTKIHKRLRECMHVCVLERETEREREWVSD